MRKRTSEDLERLATLEAVDPHGRVKRGCKQLKAILVELDLFCVNGTRTSHEMRTDVTPFVCA